MAHKPHSPFAIRVEDVRKKGRGVFATKKFKRGDLIERCPVLVIPRRQSDALLSTKMEHYAFDWDNGDLALILGYGMIYNHSYKPNAKIVHNIRRRTSDIIARTTIKVGEEILVNYNGAPRDMSPLWFNVIDHRMGE
jgi:SET domain-containing protein